MIKPITLITGSSRGIGKQIGLDLLEAGHFVIFTCQTVESFNDLRTELHKKKTNSLSYTILPPLDLSNSSDIATLIIALKEQFPIIDNIVFNAGMTCRKSFKDLTQADSFEVYKMNVDTPLLITRQLFDRIQKRVIFIGSVSGHVPDSTSIPYGVTKGSLEIMTKYLAKEFADKKVTVNTLAPGYTMTEWHIKKPPEQIERIKNKILLKRFAKVKEVSHACKFLIENDYINGQTLCVDGGFNFD